MSNKKLRRNEEILALHESGVSMGEIRERYGINDSTVRKAIAHTRRDRAIVAEYRAGETPENIARRRELSWRSICAILRGCGVTEKFVLTDRSMAAPERTVENARPWSEADDDRLRELWALTGVSGLPAHSAAAIGATLMRTRNSVLSRSRRIGLPNRPDMPEEAHVRRKEPEERTPGSMSRERDPEERTAALVTLPPLPSVGLAALRPDPLPALAPDREVAGLPIAPARDFWTALGWPPPVPPGPDHPSMPRHPRACRWPIGAPGRPGFRFCEAIAHGATEPYRPYCEVHRALAFVPTKFRNVPVAA